MRDFEDSLRIICTMIVAVVFITCVTTCVKEDSKLRYSQNTVKKEN